MRDFAAPDGELGYFSKSFAVYDREGQAVRLRRDGQAHRPGRPLDLLLPVPALPALTLSASAGRGARHVGASLWAAPFFIELEEDNGEHAAGQEAHPPQREPRETINHSRISRIRTFIKAVESAIASGKKADAAEALKKVQPEIARGVARGVIHKNTASRKISRLSKRVASLG